MVASYIASSFCHIGRDSGASVRARPPAWVFGVVWPILYVLIGLSWVRLRKTMYGDILLVLNVAILVEWLVVYGCLNQRKWALYTIVAGFGLALTTMVYAMTKDPISGFMLAPYVTWMLYASLLSFWSFNVTGR